MNKTQAKKREITQFDVFNEMPEGTIDIFMHTGGGRQIGRGKSKNAIIEVVVDNETFQDFAYQKTYGGETKQGRNKKFFIMYAVDADEYDKQHNKLKQQV